MDKTMQKNLAIILVLIAVFVSVGVAALLLMRTSEPSSTPQQRVEPTITVVRTPDGYEPKDITIKVGDTVEWVNESGEYHWPASDLHPTHGVYPEFDPMAPVAPDTAWQFTFTQAGEWRYHDHIRANKTGTVVVTQ